MPQLNEPDDLRAKLGRAVAALIGPPGDIVALERLTGGATKATWAFTARIGADETPLILQLSSPRTADPGDPLAALPKVHGPREAALMQAAGAAGVPAPPVRAVLGAEWGIGDGVVTDRVPGETIARRILRGEAFATLRQVFARQCGEIAARLHAIDPATVPFLAERAPAQEIAAYRRIYESYDRPVPAIELGLRWAEDHLAGPCRRAVVHGDFRLGNFICGEDRIRAVLDWELAILGDPMADLGWLCVRTWRFGGAAPVGGIGSREDLFAAYGEASGIAVDPARVRLWEGWGSVKWAIMCLMKGQAHRRNQAERTVEAFAIGRRMEEPLYDFVRFLHEGD